MVEQSANLFPWLRTYRTGPGYFVLAKAAPSQATVDIIATALRLDPFAADLTAGLSQHAEAIGDLPRAAMARAAFHRLAPHSPFGGQP